MFTYDKYMIRKLINESIVRNLSNVNFKNKNIVTEQKLIKNISLLIEKGEIKYNRLMGATRHVTTSGGDKSAINALSNMISKGSDLKILSKSGQLLKGGPAFAYVFDIVIPRSFLSSASGRLTPAEIKQVDAVKSQLIQKLQQRGMGNSEIKSLLKQGFNQGAYGRPSVDVADDLFKSQANPGTKKTGTTQQPKTQQPKTQQPKGQSFNATKDTRRGLTKFLRSLGEPGSDLRYIEKGKYARHFFAGIDPKTGNILLRQIEYAGEQMRKPGIGGVQALSPAESKAFLQGKSKIPGLENVSKEINVKLDTNLLKSYNNSFVSADTSKPVQSKPDTSKPVQSKPKPSKASGLGKYADRFNKVISGAGGGDEAVGMANRYIQQGKFSGYFVDQIDDQGRIILKSMDGAKTTVLTKAQTNAMLGGTSKFPGLNDVGKSMTSEFKKAGMNLKFPEVKPGAQSSLTAPKASTSPDVKTSKEPAVKQSLQLGDKGKVNPDVKGAKEVITSKEPAVKQSLQLGDKGKVNPNVEVTKQNKISLVKQVKKNVIKKSAVNPAPDAKLKLLPSQKLAEEVVKGKTAPPELVKLIEESDDFKKAMKPVYQGMDDAVKNGYPLELSKKEVAKRTANALALETVVATEALPPPGILGKTPGWKVPVGGFTGGFLVGLGLTAVIKWWNGVPASELITLTDVGINLTTTYIFMKFPVLGTAALWIAAAALSGYVGWKIGDAIHNYMKGEVKDVLDSLTRSAKLRVGELIGPSNYDRDKFKTILALTGPAGWVANFFVKGSTKDSDFWKLAEEKGYPDGILSPSDVDPARREKVIAILAMWSQCKRTANEVGGEFKNMWIDKVNDPKTEVGKLNHLFRMGVLNQKAWYAEIKKRRKETAPPKEDVVINTVVGGETDKDEKPVPDPGKAETKKFNWTKYVGNDPIESDKQQIKALWINKVAELTGNTKSFNSWARWYSKLRKTGKVGIGDQAILSGSPVKSGGDDKAWNKGDHMSPDQVEFIMRRMYQGVEIKPEKIGTFKDAAGKEPKEKLKERKIIVDKNTLIKALNLL